MDAFEEKKYEGGRHAEPIGRVTPDGGFTLAELPVGRSATVAGVLPQWRGGRKFADVGIVPGARLLMEAHAPFGGLLRVKLLESSLALHRDDAVNILLEEQN